jgi:virulence-associated protein VagC
MKTAKLFKNGQSQAVRLPKEFRMTGSEVYMLIAAHALSLDLIIISNNIKEFSRIQNLKCENWISDS